MKSADRSRRFAAARRALALWVPALLLAFLPTARIQAVHRTVGPATGLDFPCAGHDCGCMTREQCLADCCCFGRQPVSCCSTETDCDEVSPVATDLLQRAVASAPPEGRVLEDFRCHGGRDPELARVLLPPFRVEVASFVTLVPPELARPSREPAARVTSRAPAPEVPPPRSKFV